tara:strand:- start:173 stop:478 length:306 start_codon:yes stop_codon:yes gene_type:complete
MINTLHTLAKGCNRELVDEWFAICWPELVESGSDQCKYYRQEWYNRFDDYGLDAIRYMDTNNTIAFIDLLKKKYRYDELKNAKKSTEKYVRIIVEDPEITG